jgi:hypothetical protein
MLLPAAQRGGKGLNTAVRVTIIDYNGGLDHRMSVEVEMGIKDEVWYIDWRLT